MSAGETIETARPIGSTEGLKRANFRSVSPSKVRALNRICKPREPLVYQNESGSLQLAPIPLGPPLAGPLRADLGEGLPVGPVDFDRYIAKRLVGWIDGELAEADLSDAVLELVLEHLVAKPLDRAESISGYRIVPKLIPIREADHAGKTAFDFRVQFDGDATDGLGSRIRLWVSSDRLAEYSLLVDRLFLPKKNDLPVFLPIRLLAGACRLSLPELRELAVGDVLLLEAKAPEWPSAWLVIAERRRIALKLDGHRARISGHLEVTMNDRNDPNIEDGSLDDLEIDVKFEIGRSHMPLRQLQMLSEGGVIPLERNYESPVDVIVGGRRVGEGEIVDIDGRIGVRLLRFKQA